jgi:hypothetical protein
MEPLTLSGMYQVNPTIEKVSDTVLVNTGTLNGCGFRPVSLSPSAFADISDGEYYPYVGEESLADGDGAVRTGNEGFSTKKRSAAFVTSGGIPQDFKGRADWYLATRLPP